MSSHRKRKHHCRNHPRVAARGKCARCGAWICTVCSTNRGGQFFCTATCLEAKPAERTTAAAPGSTRDGAGARPSARIGEPQSGPERSLIAPKPEVTELFVSEAAPAPSPAPPAPGPRLRPPPVRHVLATVAVTAVVVASATAFFQWRHALELEAVNRDLASRSDRISADFRQARITRDSLGAALAALRDSIQTSVTGRRGRQSLTFDALPNVGTVAGGLPASFDNGATDKKLVCLTFDGSAYANAASDILDTLASRRVRATMFLTGGFIRRYPDIVKRMAAEGQEIGNHTNSHPHLTTWEANRTNALRPGVTEAMLAGELHKANEALRALIGTDMAPVWRGPYGDRNPAICAWAQRAGYVHVGWRQGRTWRENLDSYDWVPDEETPGYHAPGEIFAKIMSLARTPPNGINGGIVLMHLGTERKEPERQMHRVLGKLIDELRQMGYSFVTATEMMEASGVILESLPRRNTAAADR